MKKILLLICASVVLSCTNKTKENQKTELKATENFDWLLGDWKRLDDSNGNQTFENWVKVNENEYSGFGFTLKNGDTISQEKMQIAKIKSEWNLSVSLPTEKKPTIFKLTNIEKTSFVCENELNDFPKKIHYWLKEQKLKANISNSEMKIDFEFEKIK